MSETTASGRHQIFALSDATGATAEMVVRAALVQFQEVDVEVRRLPNVTTIEEVRRAIKTAGANKGIVVHTLVSEELRQAVLLEGRKANVATIDLLGPLLLRLTDLLQITPRLQPGLLRLLGGDYIRRVEAIEYSVKHDDGQDPMGLDRADIVLVGVSRTSKTPLSIYLAGRGWRVGNVPVVLNLPLPGNLMKINQNRVVALIMNADRLVELRLARLEHSDAPSSGAYAELEQIRAELRHCRSLFRKAGWPVLDMTSKSIEEAANEIQALVAARHASDTVSTDPTGAGSKGAPGKVVSQRSRRTV